MRVTHVITRLLVGGAQENTIASVLGLGQKPGLQVDLISGPTIGPEGSLESRFDQHPGVLRVLPSLVRPVHPVQDWMACRELRNLFIAERPSIVHTHSGKAGILGRLAAAAAGVPIIIHTIHGPSFGDFQGRLANWIFLEAERRAAAVTTHFVVVADAMASQYLQAGIGIAEQFTRIFSGFELGPFLNAANDTAVREQFGIGRDDVVIGKVARLFKLKGHEDLLAIAPGLIRDCPKLKFLLVGSGAWEGRFRRMVQDLSLADHFIFTGLVPPERVPALIGIMDILVHTSRREGLARVLPQALAAGKPVVAFNCDGASEVCLDGQTGFLVRPGDLSLLHRRVLELARDRELRTRLGDAGRLLVQDKFPVKRMVDELHTLYLRLAAARLR
jgi:glycosyltransferase involved in cell wall biosynthesis